MVGGSARLEGRVCARTRHGADVTAVEDLGSQTERHLIGTATGVLETFIGGPAAPGGPVVCAAHPAGVFGEGAVNLLREIAGARVVCVNPRGIGNSSAAPQDYTLDSMVDDLEAVRRHLGVGVWDFWGMSGGGWLGLAYAARYPDALRTPTLVIGGGADPIVPLPHVRSLRDAIAGSQLLVVEGAGHVPTTARHREVVGAVRAFLPGRVH
jgi:pimeloyl-ACP methyl ester carboxylesterase